MENPITLPESSAVIETLLHFCYSPLGRPDYPKVPEGCQVTHWAEVYVAANKYHFDNDLDNVLNLKTWAEEELIKCILLRTETLLARSEIRDTASAEERAHWKETDFDDLIRGVEVLLESTSEEDDIHDCLTKIEWGVFADNDYEASWVCLIKRFPLYAARAMARQSESGWRSYHRRQRKLKQEGKKSAVTT